MHRVWVRTAIVGVVVAALIAGAVFLRSRPQGLPIADFPAVDSKGYIAAIMEKDGKSRLVAIKPDGSLREAPGSATAIDSEIVWKPDGRRVLFVSNRSPGGSLQVFEWTPDRDADPIQLTPGGASRQNPWFSPSGDQFLYASGGNILATTYPQLRSRRIMPPSSGPEGRETESGEHIHQEGDNHEHDLVSTIWTNYSEAIEGEAFSKGFLDGNTLLGQYTTSRGQVVILQNLDPADEREALPQAVFGGQAIDITYHAATAKAVVAIMDFRFPILAEVPKEAILPDGTVKTPFTNALFAIGLRDNSALPIFLSADDSQTLMSPAISPDGTRVAFVIMEKSAGAKRVTGMLVAPIEQGGVQKAQPIAQGEISSPSWSPDGQTIAFIRNGDVWTISADGQNEKNLTNGKGRFSTPLFSPMR
ncbi:MAG: LpqB family beta-propeller domain-containing protein [Fimbriimonadales bacterium]